MWQQRCRTVSNAFITILKYPDLLIITSEEWKITAGANSSCCQLCWHCGSTDIMSLMVREGMLQQRRKECGSIIVLPFKKLQEEIWSSGSRRRKQRLQGKSTGDLKKTESLFFLMPDLYFWPLKLHDAASAFRSRTEALQWYYNEYQGKKCQQSNKSAVWQTKLDLRASSHTVQH